MAARGRNWLHVDCIFSCGYGSVTCFAWPFAWPLTGADSTITSTLSSTIASEFHSLAIISWLGSAYLIAVTTTQPLSGKLTDIFGRRSGFVLCLVLFGLGNLTCGLARSKGIIILGRALAGIGGGGINSIATFITSDLIPLRRRGIWHGMGMIVYTSGVGLGGVIGGAINEKWGWRWAFIALTPLTVISGLGTAYYLPSRASSKNQSLVSQLRRIDFGGSVALVLAISLLLIGLNQEDFSAASSRHVLNIVLPLAAASFVAFVVIELYYAREPVFPIELFKKRTVSGACLACLFTSMAVYTLMFYVPLYFQLRGYNTRETGIRLLPEPIGGGVGSLVAGIIMRCTGRYGILKTIILGLFIAGSTGFATVSLGTPFILPELFLFFNGVGLGGILSVMLLALLSSVKHEYQAVTTSIQYAFRSVGATIGISVSSVVFRKLVKSRLGGVAVPGVLYSNAGIGDLGDVLRHCSHAVQGRQEDCPQLMNSYMYALHGTFLLAMSFAIAGFISGMVTKNYRLRSGFEDEETEAENSK